MSWRGPEVSIPSIISELSDARNDAVELNKELDVYLLHEDREIISSA